MPKKRNRNRRKDAQHIRLYRYITNSAAYLSLNCAARAILIEIAGVFDGYNNGRLGMSVRTLARRCHLAPGTVTKALRELQDRGFIECVTRGSFNRKVQRASEWRLTWWACNVTGRPPEQPFMQWGKQNAVSK
jgi:MarR family